MREGRKAASLGMILAICAHLSACAPSASIDSAEADPRHAGTCQIDPKPEGAAAADQRSASSSSTIERPEKIGIGTFEVFGLPRMLRDVELIEAAWFYNWRSALPALSVVGWHIGDDVSLGGVEGDLHVVLAPSGEDAWVIQSVEVEAGQAYELHVHVGGAPSARGGVAVKFLGEGGTSLDRRWVPIEGGQGTVRLPGIVAPPGVVEAEIVAWRSAGPRLVIDDVSLIARGVDVVENGNFESSDDTGSVPQDFVPMIWGREDVTAEKLSDVSRAGVALGFNEPDLAEQSNMTVREALGFWPQLTATGARLGSPATTMQGSLGPESWLARFMAEANARGLRVDFMAVHYYTAHPDVAAFRKFLQDVHEAYDRPIWVTEWGLVDWEDHDRFGPEETATFLREGTLMMDDLDFVERHAWFGAYDGLGGYNVNTHLFETSGDLTAVGEVFADLAGRCERLASALGTGAGRRERPRGQQRPMPRSHAKTRHARDQVTDQRRGGARTPCCGPSPETVTS